MSKVKDRYRMGFHLMPPTGWLNDPNGCCQFKGTYHVFHQYMPNYPNTFPRAWGHAYSDDLVTWHHTGLSIREDSPFDAHGAYSGCGFVEGAGDTLRIFYTGNFKEPGEHDFTYEGRWAFQITTTTTDALTFTKKEVVLSPQDYPDYCTCHVRDPKVWVQDNGDGRPYRMLLGARDVDDNGFIMVYDSRDKLDWRLRSTVRAKEHFGYMWECPDRLAFADDKGKMHEFLVFCPQRTAEETPEHENRDITGYMPMPGFVLNATTIDTSKFIRWDHGFDFYASQDFVDEGGRSIMFAWMGLPDSPFVSQKKSMNWSQCITVPRLITMGPDGLLRQNPVPELERLREQEVTPKKHKLTFSQHRADVVVSGIEGDFTLSLDGALKMKFADGKATLKFTGDPKIAGGRDERSCELPAATDVRVLVDSSAVEFFVNGGKECFATRWFPKAKHLTVKLRGTYGDVKAWEMGDGMRDTYEA